MAEAEHERVNGASKALQASRELVRKYKEGTPEHFLGQGYLETGDGHSIYWERWGNPASKPIIHLHGGPGASVSKSHFELYDFSKHNVLFFDQRGCGESKPFGEILNNNTELLVGDIERLRDEVGVTGKAYLSGGSWGATLPLAYAEKYPDHVERQLLWSPFLGRPQDIEEIYKDRSNDPDFPYHEAHDRFMGHVPVESRMDPRKALEFYAEKIFSENPDEAHFYAVEYHLHTYTLCSLPEFNLEETHHELSADPNIVPYARVEIHFLLNMDKPEFDPKILENIDRIRHIPTTVITGTLDYCTPSEQAHELKAAWPEMNLVTVPSGHIRFDPRGMKQAIQEGLKDFV